MLLFCYLKHQLDSLPEEPACHQQTTSWQCVKQTHFESGKSNICCSIYTGIALAFIMYHTSAVINTNLCQMGTNQCLGYCFLVISVSVRTSSLCEHKTADDHLVPLTSLHVVELCHDVLEGWRMCPLWLAQRPALLKTLSRVGGHREGRARCTAGSWCGLVWLFPLIKEWAGCGQGAFSKCCFHSIFCCQRRKERDIEIFPRKCSLCPALMAAPGA